eukprot:CAMPEP_0204125582 /NCGR_PEP_ID=MMETSP0361-20130328/10517_1 /ASSEMBLY_ACC=CAM_ASM_000343 /TAXON_ID=268821 /ORGANISM="Scrippsiella Hangoei, Strain SHTV-5" /LENGTH=63 /DNA_ID=CAMNT_0051077335 /DNA_START=96 /DNA_END=283 /DNA_ORIENTATION=-
MAMRSRALRAIVEQYVLWPQYMGMYTPHNGGYTPILEVRRMLYSIFPSALYSVTLQRAISVCT